MVELGSEFFVLYLKFWENCIYKKIGVCDWVIVDLDKGSE